MNPLDALRGLDALAPISQPGRTSRPAAAGFDTALESLLDPLTPRQDRSTETSGEPADDSAQGVKLSRHASARLESRGLSFDAADEAQLESAIDELDQRGSKKALVLTGDRAWIVGVPKRTVITVLSRQEALGQVFTDLDSTYVAPDR